MDISVPTQTDKPNLQPTTAKTAAANNHIGSLLIDAGSILPHDAERALRYAKEKGLRFGEAAIALGLVTRQEIERVVALQFDYPYLVPGESAVSTEVLAAYAPSSPKVEAFRALRSQLLLRWFGDSEDHRGLAIVSRNRRDGRSYLAANLAVVFSQLGEQTLLVDADMRSPRQHEVFGLANTVGLSTMLAGRAGLEAAHRIPGLLALSVLPAGPKPPNPQELLNRATFLRLLHEWVRYFDVILFDTSASCAGADAQVVASRVKGALLVTRTNKSKHSEVKALCEDLTGSGVSMVGAVVNR
jgi:protein-tyrosine kinase